MMRVGPLANLLPQALVIEPSSELTFRGRLHAVCIATLVLTNPSVRTVFFKVKSNAPLFFTVNPTVGFISPGESLSVELERYPTNTAEKYELQRHSFMILSAFGPDTNICPKQFWKNVETVEVMRTKLRAVFTESSPALVQRPGIYTNNRDPVTLERDTELRERAQRQIDFLTKEPSWIVKFCHVLLFGQFADDRFTLDANQQVVGLIVVYLVLILVVSFVGRFIKDNVY